MLVLYIMESWKNNEEIKIFQEYLRIPSVHPNIEYGEEPNYLNRFYFNSFIFFLFKNPVLSF